MLLYSVMAIQVIYKVESGKTYTLFGEQNLVYERNKIDINQHIDPRGILARLGQKLFVENTFTDELEIRVSFFELYLEQIRDLTRDLPPQYTDRKCNDDRLSELTTYEKENLHIVDKGSKSIIKGLNQYHISTSEQMCEVYEFGVTHSIRSTTAKSTKLNIIHIQSFLTPSTISASTQR
jgi:hypothetical protein